jgi:hypothetical protein
MRNGETMVWPYDPSIDFVDFRVVATDGRAGTVDAETYDRPPGQLVVRGGWRDSWRRTVLTNQVITDVDHFDRTVRVALTRAQIRDLPELGADAGPHPYTGGGGHERPE